VEPSIRLERFGDMADNQTVTPPLRDGSPRRTRSGFVWDVLALQVKLIIGSLLGFVLGPATLAAAFLDLIFKSGSHGSRFYRVLDWGRQSDQALGLYAALHRRSETDKCVDQATTAD